jgi:hypothetical protein
MTKNTASGVSHEISRRKKVEIAKDVNLVRHKQELVGNVLREKKLLVTIMVGYRSILVNLKTKLVFKQ